MTRTALVRDKRTKILTIKRSGQHDHTSQKEFATELRANGFAVIKIFNGDLSDEEVDERSPI